MSKTPTGPWPRILISIPPHTRVQIDAEASRLKLSRAEVMRRMMDAGMPAVAALPAPREEAS